MGVSTRGEGDPPQARGALRYRICRLMDWLMVPVASLLQQGHLLYAKNDLFPANYRIPDGVLVIPEISIA